MKIEDFEFNNVIKETEYGKTLFAKLTSTGAYFEVLVMRKDRLIKKNLLGSLKEHIDIYSLANHPFHATM